MLTPANRLKVAKLIIKCGSSSRAAAKLRVSPNALRKYRHTYLAKCKPVGNYKVFEDRYLVYDDGRVWSKREFKFLRPFVGGGGYLTVDIHGRKMALHRLVLTVFKRPPKPGEEGRHYKDPDITNNHISNLRWGTSLQNGHDKMKHGTVSRGEDFVHAKLTEERVRMLRRRYAAGERGLARKYASKWGVHYTIIDKAIQGKSWRHVR